MFGFSKYSGSKESLFSLAQQVLENFTQFLLFKIVTKFPMRTKHHTQYNRQVTTVWVQRLKA